MRDLQFWKDRLKYHTHQLSEWQDLKANIVLRTPTQAAQRLREVQRRPKKKLPVPKWYRIKRTWGIASQTLVKVERKIRKHQRAIAYCQLQIERNQPKTIWQHLDRG